MPKIHCCLCTRRTDTNKKRARIGTASVWPMFKIHAEKNGLDLTRFSPEDYICMKCHSTISHHRMKDRGPNKKIKVMKPFIFAPNIKKDVLRGFAKNTVSSAAQSNNNDMITVSTSATEEDSDELGTEHASSTFDDEFNLSTNDKFQTISPVEQQSSVLSAELTCSETVLIPPAVNNDFDSEDILSTTDAINENIQNTSYDQQSSVVSQDSSSVQLQENVSKNVENTSHQMSSVMSQDSSSIQLQGIKSTQSRCFICQSATGRKAVPWAAIQQAWFQKRCFIPKSNRMCKEHLTSCNKFSDAALQKIEDSKQDIDVNSSDFGIWLIEISDLSTSAPYNFEEDGIDAANYKMFLGINKGNFDDLVQYLHGMRNTATRSIRNALAMFLLLLRNNMKQEIIAFNFSTSQQVVSSTIDAVSAALEEYFVPKNLGYYHITREEALEKHSIKLTSKVLGQSETRLCLIADCTYNYIEKPSDFELQRKTFSAHKKRNLLKPLYIVLPSGYILEAAGPYFCDAKNNDAANIRHHYKTSDLLLFLEEDDFFIFDRGFRDVVKETTDNGQSVFMPSLLGGKRTHFTCEEANESRKVTMNRWVVEAVNARVKNIFPFFKHMIEGTYVPKIMRFNRIACAMINKYFPPLFSDKEFHEVILQETTNLTCNDNQLKEEIEQLGIQRMTARWEKATENSIPDFPELTMEDLKRLTLGTYQIKIAEKYIEHHIKGDNHFGIFIHRENEGIIRAKIQSRFSRSKTHNTWVKYDGDEVGYLAIKGLYCSCKVGERSLGCCSHLASVVRYLGYDRHQPYKPKSFCRMPWDAIDCNEGDNNNSSEDEVDEFDL